MCTCVYLTAGESRSTALLAGLRVGTLSPRFSHSGFGRSYCQKSGSDRNVMGVSVIG